jgi:hypothetical protein
MVEKRTIDRFFSAAGHEYESKIDALRADVVVSLEGLKTDLGYSNSRELFGLCIRDDQFWTAFKAERDRLKAEYGAL